MVSTVFSSAVFAEKPGEKIKDKIVEIVDKIVDKIEETSQEVKGESLGKSLTNSAISELSALRKGIFSPSLVTKYKDVVKTTRMRQFLPTAIDVDDDGTKDIRVWIIRRPGIDLRPPAVCLKTSLWVRRLAGMDSLKDSSFEIYLEYTPDRISAKIPSLERIRIGYESPRVEDLPKSCVVSHKYIPHLLYPRKQVTHRISINPGAMIGKAPLNLLLSLADIENNSVKSEISIQVNHSPAIRNEMSFSMSKEGLIGRGETLELSRKVVSSSNVSVTIKHTTSEDTGFVKIENIPKKVTLSWQLTEKGHIELNTHGSGTGPVNAAVDGAISLGFVPTTGVNFRLGWNTNRLTTAGALLGAIRGKGLYLEIDAKGSATLSDLYVYLPSSTLLNMIKPKAFKLVASLLSFDLKAGANVGNLVLKPITNPSANNIDFEVTDLDVVLENCSVGLQDIELPSVSITCPEQEDVVSGKVTINGTASTLLDKEIKSVKIMIDDGNWTTAIGTISWSYEWDTTNLLNGNHLITVECLDSRGYTSSSSRTVVVDNPGVNWYPTVKILTPSKLDVLLNDAVTISGTAYDYDDGITKVEISFNQKDWIEVDGTTQWSYEWNISKLGGGKYYIFARSYDHTTSTIDTYIHYLQVFVRFADVLKASISSASIDVTNLVLENIATSGNKTGLTITSFNADGSGSLTLGNKAVSLSGEGNLAIINTSIFTTNASAKTMLLENLALNFNGNGYLELSKDKLALELDASINVSADNVLGIKNIIFGAKGKASADILIEELGGVTLGAEEDYFDFNVTDLVLEVGDIISVGAKRISASGKGTIYIKDKKITLSSDSIECHIDELSVNTVLGVFSVSGNLELSQHGELTAEFIDLFNFSVSYDGLTNLVITEFEFKVISSKTTAAVNAESVTIKPEGHAGISYYQEELNITCCIEVHNITMNGLILSFNDSFYGPFDVTGDFDACFTLNSDLKIDFGPDWIRITIGGNGRADLDIHAQIRNINNYRGYLAAEMSLASGSDSFVINISNISGNAHIDVLGSAVLSLELFELYLENRTTYAELVNISIENFMVSFGINASIEKSEIVLIVEEAGLSLDNGHVYVSIKEKVNMSLYGTIDVDMSANLSGSMKFEFNETGLENLSVDFTGDVNIEIADLNFAYVNKVKSTNIALEVGVISINGNADIHITKDYIEAGIGVGDDTKTQGDKKGSKESQDGSGILIEDFMFNATLTSLDFNALVEFDVLDIVSGVKINISDGIIIDTSSDVTLNDFYLVVNSDSRLIYMTVDVDNFEITGGGGGKVVIDKNLSLISGSAYNTNMVIQNASLDVAINDMILFLILEDADVSFMGSNVEMNIDLTQGIMLHADLTGDAKITVNTLWGYLSTTYIEIRIYDLEIIGKTTISVDFDLNGDVPLMVDIHAPEGFKAGEFTMVGYVNLYGLDGGPDISIGLDNKGYFLIGIEGLWTFDQILVYNLVLLVDVEFEGNINPLSLAFAGDYIYLAGKVNDYSKILFKLPIMLAFRDRPLQVILEPGNFALNLNMPEELVIDNLHIAVVGYSDSLIKIKRYDPILLQNLTWLEFTGQIEATINVNSLSTLLQGANERDIDFELDLKGNHDLEILNGFLVINGSGELHIDIEATGSLLTGDFYGSFEATWNCDRYVTMPYLLPYWGRKWAFEGTGEVDYSFGEESSSEEYIVETSEAILVLNENTQTFQIYGANENLLLEGSVVIEESGEILIMDQQGQPIYEDGMENTNLIINNINIQEFFQNIFGNIYRWHWSFILQGWIRIPILDTRPAPIVNGAVTLLSKPAGGTGMYVGYYEDLPGTNISLIAWYNPGPENVGPYSFVFNFDNGSEPVTINVGGSDEAIVVETDDLMYTEPDTYTPSVTVIDHGNNQDTTSDTTTIAIVEKYFDVSQGRFDWQFEDIAEQLNEENELTGYFYVENIAKEIYSPGYTIEWDLTGYEDMEWGTDWVFAPTNGVLGPNSSQRVNFSFVPPDVPQEYGSENNTISIKKINDPTESIDVGFSINYGIIDLFPVTNPLLYVPKDQDTTIDGVLWIWNLRWEVLEWELIDMSTDPNLALIDYSFTKTQGTINPGDPLQSIGLNVYFSNEQFENGSIKVKIQRKSDPTDNVTKTINIRATVFGGGSGQGSEWVTPDWHVQNWWYYPRRAHDGNPSSFSSYRRLHGGWTWDPLILTLDDPIDCCGFRINAKAGDNLDKLNVTLYNDNVQMFSKEFLDGQWNDYDWTEWSSNTESKIVNRAEIKMRLSTGTFKLHWAVIREFDFKESQ